MTGRNRKAFFSQPNRSEQYTTGFIQRFTSASQEHYHYENGKHDV
ncbi:DUF7710 domain-containing protein [Hymenobacter sp. 102]